MPGIGGTSSRVIRLRPVGETIAAADRVRVLVAARPLVRRLAIGEQTALALLVGFALAARVTMALIVPPWQGPDEPRHFEYVRILVDRREELWHERRLIEMDDTIPTLQTEIIASMSRHHFWEHTNARRPPVLPSSFFEIWAGSSTQLKQKYSPYHWILAAAVLPFERISLEGQLLVARLVSALLSTLTVVATWSLARAVAPSDPFVWLSAAGFVAALPMHVFMGGTVNTDNMVTLLGAVCLALLAGGLRRGMSVGRWLLVLATLLLAIAAKRAAVALLPSVLVAFGSHLREMLRSRPARIAAAVGGITLVAAAFGVMLGLPPLDRVRAWLEFYFLNEPDQVSRIFDGRLTSALAWQLVPHYLYQLHNSFWGVFGWYSIQFREWIYQVLLVVSLACLLGVGLRVVLFLKKDRRTRGAWDVGLLCPLVVATLTVLSVLERMTYLDLRGVPQGRYLFAGVAAIGVMFGLGLRAYLPRRLGSWLPAALVISMLVVMDLGVLRNTIWPAYVTRPFP